MRFKIAVAALICALAHTAVADVADSAASGFTLKIVTQIQASPADVYKLLVHNVGDWWNSAHSFSGDAHNLSIEDRPLGCFCEKLSGGGGLRHMEVIFAAPGKLLRMSGGLGPLQGMATAGSMTFAFTPAEGGTKLEVTYAVLGYSAQGMSALAAPVNMVLTEQIMRLKSYIETGKPAGGAEPQKK
jgi:uncharacterized protein YndB with AHSA1/START domain